MVLRNRQLHESSEQAIQKEVALVPCELSGVGKAKDRHDIVQNHIKTPLNGD